MSVSSGTPSLENFDDLPPVEDDVSFDLDDFENFGSEAAIPELEDSYITTAFQDVPNVENLILNRTGSNLVQAYITGLAAELDWSKLDVLELFMDIGEGTVDKDYFDEEVYGDIRLRQYEWELKNLMQKAGCDRGVFFNKFKNIQNGDDRIQHYPCGSVFCPKCHSKLILRSKEKLLKYVMDVPHTHFTFTLNESAWEEISYFRDTEVESHTGQKPPRFIDHLYNSVGEAVKYVYKKYYDVEVGFIINTHTFSSETLKWQPHADVFISLYGWDDSGEVVPCVHNGVLPEDRKGVNTDLLKDLRKVFTAEFVSRISKQKIPNDYEEMTERDVKKLFDRSIFLERPDTSDGYYWVYQNKNGDGEILTRKLVEFKDLDNVTPEDIEEDGRKIGGGLLGDSLRYFKRLPIADENIHFVRDDFIIFTTEKRKKKGLSPMMMTPIEFYERVSQHMKPRGFRAMRPYGIYSYNHNAHDEAARQKGYDVGFDMSFKNDLTEIAKVVLHEIVELGDAIDKHHGEGGDKYKNILGYIVVNSIKRLEKKEILPDNLDFQGRMANVVQALIDYCCNYVEYDDHGNTVTESPVLSARELLGLMCYDEGKDVKADHGLEGYEIYDQVKKRVFSNLASDCLTSDDGDLFLWHGFSAYGELVRYSFLSLAIFNEKDLKNKHKSLNSLITDSNHYFPSLDDKGGDYS